MTYQWDITRDTWKCKCMSWQSLSWSYRSVRKALIPYNTNTSLSAWERAGFDGNGGEAASKTKLCANFTDEKRVWSPRKDRDAKWNRAVHWREDWIRSAESVVLSDASLPPPGPQHKTGGEGKVDNELSCIGKCCLAAMWLLLCFWTSKGTKIALQFLKDWV